MKKIFLAIFSCFLVLSMTAQINTDAGKTAAILKKMTLEEKVGQMTQVTIALVSKGGWSDTEGNMDPVGLKTAIVDHKVGSILNVNSHALSVDKWHEVITAIQDEVKNSRLKIPIIYGLDGIHGQTYTLNSTLFPQNIAMAATRNTDLVRAEAKTTAKELRASGVRWNFAPVLDCGRQPLWSRFPETYGEDVYIGTTMGSTAITAYEEDGLKKTTAVASCMKHYLAYSASRTGKDRTPIYLSEVELRELLPAAISCSY